MDGTNMVTYSLDPDTTELVYYVGREGTELRNQLGIYSCTATNQLGTLTKQAELKFDYE